MGEGTGEIDDGHTAWILISCALVNFMTPGLAFFYGGLVRRNHVLRVAQRPSSFSSSEQLFRRRRETPRRAQVHHHPELRVHGHHHAGLGRLGLQPLLRRVGCVPSVSETRTCAAMACCGTVP